MWLPFYPLQHVSLRIAYTATAINQVVYCRFLWRLSWLVTLISLRRKENGIYSYSPKHPHIPVFKKINPNWILKLRTGRLWQLSEQELPHRRSLPYGHVASSLRFGLKIYIQFHRNLQYGRRGINSSISAKSIYYVTHCQPLSGDNWDIRGAGRHMLKCESGLQPTPKADLVWLMSGHQDCWVWVGHWDNTVN